MPITNATITEAELDRARLVLALHRVMVRARKIIPRQADGALRIPDFEVRVERRGVRYPLRAYVSRLFDHYYVELCADPHAHGESRVSLYEAEVVVASRGSWRLGLDLVVLGCSLVDRATVDALHSALERVFGVAGADAHYLPPAREPKVRATIAGEG